MSIQRASAEEPIPSSAKELHGPFRNHSLNHRQTPCLPVVSRIAFELEIQQLPQGIPLGVGNNRPGFFNEIVIDARQQRSYVFPHRAKALKDIQRYKAEQ